MKRNIFLTLLFVLMVFVQSCEDFLEEKPKGFASSENVLNSETGITQALYGVYHTGTTLFWRERYPSAFGLPGDDLFTGVDNNTARIEMDNFTFTSTNANIGRIWTNDVIMISRANQLIEGIENYEEGEFKDRIIAEAKFLRAMCYFYQVRAFGAVPLVTEYENAELYPSRSTIPEIYQQIIADLTDAEQNLPNWQEISGEKGRATSGAAKAFLGKVYLTMATTEETANGNYFSMAADKLQEVIDGGYGLIDNYVEAFWPENEGGAEDVWAWQFVYNGSSGKQGYIHAQFAPNPDIYNKRGFNRLTIMPYLYDMLEDQDQRKLAMVKGAYTAYEYNESGSIADTFEYETQNDYPFTMKFADPNWSRFYHNNTDINWPIIRFSDVLLMHSEAVNEADGSTDDAYYGIDLVRARSDASTLDRGLSQEELRQKIRDERLLELHGEGHRWFDLVRWSILAERIKEVSPEASVQWPRHRFFPIPQSEVDANPNLDQTEGY